MLTIAVVTVAIAAAGIVIALAGDDSNSGNTSTSAQAAPDVAPTTSSAVSAAYTQVLVAGSQAGSGPGLVASEDLDRLAGLIFETFGFEVVVVDLTDSAPTTSGVYYAAGFDELATQIASMFDPDAPVAPWPTDGLGPDIDRDSTPLAVVFGTDGRIRPPSS